MSSGCAHRERSQLMPPATHGTPQSQSVTPSRHPKLGGGGGGGGVSDFRSSRINRRGSQASPTHPSSGQRIAHSPRGWGTCVWGGGPRNERADACCSHISTRPQREAPTVILRMNKINGGSSENEPLVRDVSGIQESQVGTGRLGGGVGMALAKGRDCHPRARGAEVAVNEGRAPLEMKGTW